MQADPFGSAKTNLRETIKWLVTLFSGLAAAVVGGASIVGLASLKESVRTEALLCGGFGVICLFVAAGVALRLLTAESFHVGDIAEDAALRRRLDQFASDVLPPEFSTAEEFVESRTKAILRIRRYVAQPDGQEYKEARSFLLSIDAPLQRFLNVAHFESMRMAFDRRIPLLFVLAIGALLGLGSFAVLVGSEKTAQSTWNLGGGPIVLLDRGAKETAEVYLKSCTSPGNVRAEIVGQPRENWVTVRILEPDGCRGTVLSIPAGLAILGTAP